MTPAHKRDRERLALVLRSLRSIQRVVDEQAEDEGLWFFSTRISEAYLQQELRKLHAMIENEFVRIRAMRKGDR